MSDRRPLEADGNRRLVLPRLCAATSAAIGVIVLVGWALDLEVLKSVAPGLVTMKPNAALAFLLGGLALGWIREDRRRNRVAIGLAASVAAIGWFTLLEHACRVDLGFDQLLARDSPGAVAMMAPGRMHPATALDLTLLGIAMILMALDCGHRMAHWLSLAASLIAGSSLVGYCYGVRFFLGMASLNQMAVHTASGMLILSLGILTIRPASGLMKAITGDTPGGQMARRLLPIAFGVPIVLDGMALLAEWAGVFDARYATATRVIVTISVLVGCIGWNAHALQRLDEQRRRSDQSLRILTDAIPQIVWTANPDGMIDYFNRQGLAYTGLDLEEVARGGLDSVIHPDDRPSRVEAWKRAIRSGRGFQLESRIRRTSDRSYRWHLGQAEPMRDDSGRIIRWFGTCTDIHDQKILGERRYRSLVEATTAIVWNTPASGEFESEQQGWSDFTGQSFDELRGWGWLDAIHPEDRAETVRVWSKTVANRSTYRVEHRIRRADGEYRHMMVRAIPILSEDGTIHEWIGVHTDIDLQKRAEAALREAKEAAEAATRAKGEFLANMSHEIRTPMNGILGMTELTLGTELSDRQREYLGLVKSSADALLTVIDDILDFSKIEAGKLTLDPVPFKIRDAVTDTLRSLALRAHGKGLELACRVAPDVPDSVIGDQGRIRQVLVNLVGNAIKFTEAGEVCVSVEAGPDGALHFAVADTGIGIPEAKRAAIFAPFEQADGSTTRKYGGTGLGLTISSRLVSLMGGRIWVEDHPERGSIFKFTAHLEPDPEERTAAVSRVSGRLEGLPILIVDDNRTNRLILEELLTQWGCRPRSTSGGAEALTILAEAAGQGDPFRLVLLDRMMPGMDGTELARRILGELGPDGPRMLMLTSGGSDESGRFRELGIGGWLSKPVRHSDLYDAVMDVLGPDDGFLPVEATQPMEADLKPMRRYLRILLAEDHPVNQKVAGRMLESLGHEVTIVGNGREAVESADSAQFDLILMDVQMPEMDGFEATAAIRLREGRGRRTPIIALTAHAMAGDRERCLGSGFDDYLSKPIQAATLQSALERIDWPEADPPPRGPGEDAGRPPSFDRRAALENLGGDSELLDEVVGLFLDDCPRLLGAIHEALGSGDSATLERLTHTVSGVASNFAAKSIAEPALKLQVMSKSGNLAGAGVIEGELARAVERFREEVGASRAHSPA
ncbi:response regulator [Tundrisphaera lichenicola]|uniref:hybrid sensor histidine kinase/response regulator n=1 Tax=Tundrisphaera lichenicola TaxID=2029860 RepID=UPI003EB9F15E